MKKLKYIFLFLISLLFLIACKEKTIEISFDSIGGSIVNSIKYSLGEELILPIDPIKEGYTFEGWFLDENYDQELNVLFLPVEDFTLYAKWHEIESTLDEQLQDIYYLALDANVFSGTYEEWLDSVRGPQGASAYDIYKKYFPNYTKSEEEWLSDLINGRLGIIKTWDVVFDYQDDISLPEVITIEHLTKIDKPADPVREGYTFVGWFIDDEQWVFSGHLVTSNLTLKARWSQTFGSISFNTNSSSYIAPITGAPGSSFTHPEDPVRQGYTFIGWNPSLPNLIPEGSVILNAMWEKIEYSTDYIANSQIQVFLVEANPDQGFNMPYYIYLPSTTNKSKNEGFKNYLILEGLNNNIIGNNIELLLQMNQEAGKYTHVVTNLMEELFLPKIIPFIPKSCVSYTYSDGYQEDGHFHGLDSTLIYLEERINDMQICKYPWDDADNTVTREYLESLFHIDEQIHAIVLDAQRRLNASGWNLEEQIFVAGFSASGSFADAYTAMYPEQVKAMYAGGLFVPTLPAKTYKDQNLIYQIGVYEHERLFGKIFDIDAYNRVAKVFYMGEGEINDAVLANDVFGRDQKDLIYNLYGRDSINQRWYNAQDAFFEVGGQAMFITDKTMRHATSNEVLQYLFNFFRENRNSEEAVYIHETTHPQLVLNLNGNKIEDPDFFYDFEAQVNVGAVSILGEREPVELFGSQFKSSFSRVIYTGFFSGDAPYSEFLVFLIYANYQIIDLDDYFANVTLPENDIAYYTFKGKNIMYIHATTKEELIAVIEGLTIDQIKNINNYVNAPSLE